MTEREIATALTFVHEGRIYRMRESKIALPLTHLESRFP